LHDLSSGACNLAYMDRKKYDLGFVLLLAFLGGAIIFVLWPYL
jgi:hypothetical protein